MKKGLGLVCFIIGLCVVFGACSSSETYADKVEKERKNINRFINEHNITVINQYPASGVFKENEYFRDPLSGIYIHVVDSGNGIRANVSKRSVVTVRCIDPILLPKDTIPVSNTTGTQPIEFNYGISATYQNSSSGVLDYYLLSPGLVVPLKYVGEHARVSLIVPFSQGSTYQQAVFGALYFPLLEYTAIINN